MEIRDFFKNVHKVIADIDAKDGTVLTVSGRPVATLNKYVEPKPKREKKKESEEEDKKSSFFKMGND